MIPDIIRLNAEQSRELLASAEGEPAWLVRAKERRRERTRGDVAVQAITQTTKADMLRLLSNVQPRTDRE